MKKTSSVHTIFQDLLQCIQKNNEVKSISEQFSNLATNPERVNFAYKLLEYNKLFPELIFDEKCDKTAARLREEGNAKFKNKKLKEAVEMYTRSLANARKNSDAFSIALANRSAALFEMELYDECLIDINRALQNNYPEDLKPKLLKRQEKAIELRKTNCKIIYCDSIPDIPNSSKSISIQCASNSIEIKQSESHGRHVVATRDINIGEVLAIEKPFCHILASGYTDHCHDCLKLCYNLVPCLNCTQTLYCDTNCRKNAEKYHKYQCNILKTLNEWHLDKMKLLPLKIALNVKDLYHTITNYVQIDENEKYQSDRYNEIHNLISNTDRRTVSDLFERSTTAAIIFYLIETHTNFFGSDDNKTVFKDLLLLHLQTAPCNFHEISETTKTKDGHYESEEIGAGAFAFLSLFNHSCNPNVVRHCYGDVVVVRAIRSISNGEQCYDNYGYHFAVMSKAIRANSLKSQYFFDCNCNVCENDWPLLANLPSTDFETGVSNEDIISLRKGDKKVAKEVFQKLLLKMTQLEKVQPNRQFFEMQEVLKQCYALFGNVYPY